MSISTLAWKLASPYDAYVSHVDVLQDAIKRIRYYSERAQAYEAGLESSVRIVPGETNPAARAQRFRQQLATAAAEMSDEEFEGFIAQLGGGNVAEVESNRAQTVSRLSLTTRGMEQYFGIAGRELAILERRGYNPRRRDVARHLKANGLPATTVAEFRHQLHELGTRASTTA